MIATAFDEENAVLDPPVGVSNEDVQCLSVFRGHTDGGVPVVISCWKPTPEEWEEMRRTDRVWVMVCGATMPPIAVIGKKPWPTNPESSDTLDS